MTRSAVLVVLSWVVLGVSTVSFAWAGAQGERLPLRAAPSASAARAGSSPPPARVPERNTKSTGAGNITDSMPCSACHTTTAWSAQGSTSAGQKFDHSKTGFPLTGEHQNTPCVGCHDGTRKIGRDCASCHDDFHRGRLSQSCDRCHSAADWHLTRPLEVHRMTRFPLTGMHVLADCTECHRRASEQKFTDAPIACFACHEKDYRRPDLFPVHVGTATEAPLPRDCNQCHRPLAWVPALGVGARAFASGGAALQTAPPNHDLRFPISFGVHRTASCDDCHASRAAPRAVRCIGCHAHDPVRLMQEHKTAVATDGPACLGCHQAGARR